MVLGRAEKCTLAKKLGEGVACITPPKVSCRFWEWFGPDSLESANRIFICRSSSPFLASFSPIFWISGLFFSIAGRRSRNIRTHNFRVSGKKRA